MLFGVWSIQGIIALIWLLSIPTDTENPVVFGFSPARTGLIGVAIVLTTISLLLWHRSRSVRFGQTWLELDEHSLLWDLVYTATLMTVLATIVFLSTIPLFIKSNPVYPVYAARLLPVLLWLGISSLELTVLIAWNRYARARDIIAALHPIWKEVIFLLVIFLLLGIWIAATKIGITRDDNWGAPPVPFLEWQIAFALIVIGVFSFLPHRFSRKYSTWIPFGIYVFTVCLWLSQSINPAFAAMPPRAPNFEIYPFSDAQFYAQYAQSALAGNGFLWPEVPTRPFYVAVLTWLHLFGSQSYQRVILLQTLLLAFFPVLLYLVGRELAGTPVGMGLALLAAFRDVNANIAVPFASNVTYSKLFLSELPTALLISLATWLSLRWLRAAQRSLWLPLLAGGVLGLAALIRLQSSVLVGIILLLALVVIPDRKVWLRGSIVAAIGFALVITPWLVRNYIAGGGMVLDNPISQTMTMARRWSGSTGNEILPRLPGETDAQYSSRLTNMAVRDFIRNPDFILRNATNHFINNEIASLLAFPVRDEIRSPAEILMPQRLFWKTPLVSGQLPLFAFYLLLFAIGLVTAYQRHRLIGLLPLGLGLMYNVWTALFLSSGERFIVPLDWSVHLYQVFGMLILGELLFSFVDRTRGNLATWIENRSEPQTISEPTRSSRRRFLLSLGLIVFLGAFLPLTEFVFPERYPPKSQEAIQRHVGVPAGENEVALYGRAIYPRYYDSGEGESGTAKIGYGPEERARLVFFLVGPQNGLVIFEQKHTPQFFPNASDVYMIGTQTENYFSPRVVKVVKDSRTEIYSNP
jgi:hypothetical protein